MLGTIKMPMNMKNIHENLPGSNYETDRPKKKKIEDIESPMQAIMEEAEEPQQRYVGQQSTMSKNNKK